jgi:hypothetical protein
MHRHYQPALLALIRSQLLANQQVCLHAAGSSMQPLIRQGDVLRVESVQPAALRRGDLLVVQRGNTLVTHRFIAMQGSMVQTRGDNCLADDPPVALDDLLGRVALLERGTIRIAMDGWLWRGTNRMLGWLSGLKGRLFEFQTGGYADQQRGLRYALVGCALLLHTVSIHVLTNAALLLTRRPVEPGEKREPITE